MLSPSVMKLRQVPSAANLRAGVILACAGLGAIADDVEADLSQWRLGQGGAPWDSWANMTIMTDDVSFPGSLQPFELDPEENFALRLGPWQFMKFPDDPDYRTGHPRIWWGVNQIVSFRGRSRSYVDGDSTSFVSYRNWPWSRLQHEFETIDLGAPAPIERFVFYAPEGTDGNTGEPYRPNFVLQKFELSGGLDGIAIQREQDGSGHRTLEVPLARSEQNFEPITQVRFPLQYFRFFRFRLLGDDLEGQFLRRAAIAEMEVYGRGFVPEATYESRAVDLGREVNFGRVHIGVSRWRKEDGIVVAAADAPVVASVEIKSGTDDSPQAFFGYNDQGEHEEVTQEEYRELKARVFAFDPPRIGWRGPVTEDQEQWNFWSVPLRESGLRPGLPPGQFFQLRIKLQTEGLWEYARIDSLAVEHFPLLASALVAEIGVVGDLTPEGGVAKIEVGEEVEFLYALKAQFAGRGQGGFDAVRVFTPAAATLTRLELGQAVEAVEPDSVRFDGSALNVYLPGRVAVDTDLRLFLRTTLYSGSTRLEGEVFDRQERALGQRIEEGDASAEIGTNRLQALGQDVTSAEILVQLRLDPRVITPNGDGRNDRTQITYTLLGVEGADVEVEFFTLSGSRVFGTSARQGNGPHTVEWDGLDQSGQPVTPGLYLCRITTRTERVTSRDIRTIAVTF